MQASLALIVLTGVLTAVGVYLILERSLTRIVIGMGALTNAVNILMLVAGGESGAPPLVGSAEKSEMADPLVQAMMLTAIVIGLGTTAFLMAMAYRSWQLNGNDEVQDDLEDRRVARRLEAAKIAARADKPQDIADDAADTYDETEGIYEDAELGGKIDAVLDQPRRIPGQSVSTHGSSNDTTTPEGDK
ncbi:MAG: Na(+)/H(+) antiporter subunit C [Actinomycetaceae bacterium]|nr:Na(+)/H(+) antiporter subunit C [Actinomycetaceae bacterium]